MNGAIISFLAYTGILTAIGIWSYKIVEKVPVSKYEQEFYAAAVLLQGVAMTGGCIGVHRAHGCRRKQLWGQAYSAHECAGYHRRHQPLRAADDS